jgi:hypothetical protein
LRRVPAAVVELYRSGQIAALVSVEVATSESLAWLTARACGLVAPDAVILSALAWMPEPGTDNPRELWHNIGPDADRDLDAEECPEGARWVEAVSVAASRMAYGWQTVDSAVLVSTVEDGSGEDSDDPYLHRARLLSEALQAAGSSTESVDADADERWAGALSDELLDKFGHSRALTFTHFAPDAGRAASASEESLLVAQPAWLGVEERR